MSKPSLGIFSAIKEAKANFNKLPGEAKTSYYIGAAIFLLITVFLIKFIVPESEQSLKLPNQGATQNKRFGENKASPGAVIPSSLAEEIIDNRQGLREQSQVVFNRFNESETKLTQKKQDFLNSVTVDLTPLNRTNAGKDIGSETDDNNGEIEEQKVQVPVNQKEVVVDDFLGPIVNDSGEIATNNNSASVLKSLLADPEIAQLWSNTIRAKDAQYNKATTAQMGATISFKRPESDLKEVEKYSKKDNGLTSEDKPIESENGTYDGDDFLPGRVILARIDGFIQSDTQTPFVRLKPVEGPKEWVEDAIFLAQPSLIDNEGFLIEVKSVTHKNKTGTLDGVVVTPDDNRNAIVVDEIESREWERLGYLVGGGFLNGLNLLANRIGTTVTNQTGSVSNVEINKESLLVSAFGGVGQRGENYLFEKLQNTPDNYMIDKNRLVGIMIVAKPEMNWLPDLDNKSVY